MWDLGDTNGTVALRMPQDDIALAVLSEVGPMAVTSANLTGQPAATTVARGGHPARRRGLGLPRRWPVPRGRGVDHRGLHHRVAGDPARGRRAPPSGCRRSWATSSCRSLARPWPPSGSASRAGPTPAGAGSSTRPGWCTGSSWPTPRERFGSIEINGSFYSLQRPSSYLAWRGQVPPEASCSRSRAAGSSRT